MSENTNTTTDSSQATPAPSNDAPTPSVQAPNPTAQALKDLLDAQAARVTPQAPTPSPPPKADKSGVAELKQQIEALKTQQVQSVWRDERSRIGSWVEEAADFPLTKALGKKGADYVFAGVYQHYQQTGEYKSEADIASQVEKDLSELRAALMNVELPETKKPPQTTPQPEIPTPTNEDASQVTQRLNESVTTSLDDSLELMLNTLRYKDGSKVKR